MASVWKQRPAEKVGEVEEAAWSWLRIKTVLKRSACDSSVEREPSGLRLSGNSTEKACRIPTPLTWEELGIGPGGLRCRVLQTALCPSQNSNLQVFTPPVPHNVTVFGDRTLKG